MLSSHKSSTFLKNFFFPFLHIVFYSIKNNKIFQSTLLKARSELVLRYKIEIKICSWFITSQVKRQYLCNLQKVSHNYKSPTPTTLHLQTCTNTSATSISNFSISLFVFLWLKVESASTQQQSLFKNKEQGSWKAIIKVSPDKEIVWFQQAW